MVARLRNKEHLIKVLKSLLQVEDMEVLKYTLSSLIESLEEGEAETEDSDISEI